MNQDNTQENNKAEEKKVDNYVSFTKVDDDGTVRETYGRFIEWPNESEIDETIEELKKELSGHSR